MLTWYLGDVVVLMESLQGLIGSAPHYFKLSDAQGSLVSIDDVIGENGLLVAFICNHCPYVVAKIERLVETMNKLARLKIGSVAIMSNDFSRYPDDSPERMVAFKEKYRLPCPYLVDLSQDVAKVYGVQCTPEFYLYTKDQQGSAGLSYRGRLDSGGKDNNSDDVPELYNAALASVQGRAVEMKQYPSIGCSIKWKGSGGDV